ncbi:opsin Rh5 [Stomoxys calcitrans]|uniref:opsin Rh5 n=1 Tax=Stomoxys calcitrans TaxID=35570 RepID=UPI0027E39874|nr:opsin Rh5 [Stomoxys calcitrans]
MHSFESPALLGPEPYASFQNGSSLASSSSLPNLGWNYPMEYQHMIHQHWRSFPVPQIYYQAFLFIGFVAMLLCSLFGNCLVLWIFSTSKNLRTPSNLLIINLAVFDTIMALNMPHYLINACLGYFWGGDLGCDVYAVIGGISGQGAAVTNAFIAYDRYRTISNPIDGRLNFPQIIIIVILTWLWTTPFSVLPLFHIWGHYIPEGFLTSCSFDYLSQDDETRYFVQSMFVWAYCTPMAIICIYYTKLFLHVRDHEKMLADQAKKMNVKSLSANQNSSSMSVEIRIAKAAMIIYLMYIFSWTPYATVALMGTFNYGHMITPFASMIPCCCAKLVSCIDPWVYAASHPKYRAELERRIPWLGVRERNVSPSVTSGDNVSNAESETGTISMSNC